MLHSKLDPVVDPLFHSKFKSIQTQTEIEQHHLKKQQQLARIKGRHWTLLMGNNKWDKLNRCRRHCPLSPPQRVPKTNKKFNSKKE